MKQKLVALLLVIILLFVVSSSTYAGGGKVRGSRGRGAVYQTQVQYPLPSYYYYYR